MKDSQVISGNKEPINKENIEVENLKLKILKQIFAIFVTKVVITLKNVLKGNEYLHIRYYI